VLYPMPFSGSEIDWRPTLQAIIEARRAGVEPPIIARAFHRSLARAVADAVVTLARDAGVDTVVLSGGVMQNELLLEDLQSAIRGPQSAIRTPQSAVVSCGSTTASPQSTAASASVRRRLAHACRARIDDGWIELGLLTLMILAFITSLIMLRGRHPSAVAARVNSPRFV